MALVPAYVKYYLLFRSCDKGLVTLSWLDASKVLLSRSSTSSVGTGRTFQGSENQWILSNSIININNKDRKISFELIVLMGRYVHLLVKRKNVFRKKYYSGDKPIKIALKWLISFKLFDFTLQHLRLYLYSNLNLKNAHLYNLRLI